jgi:glyoxylate/hydroxypyruvate reductase A
MSVAVWLGDEAETEEWVRRLSDLLPGWTLRALDDVRDPSDVTYAVVWAPPPGRLAQFSNLRATVSVGAGIDHILRDPDYPRSVPILRTTGRDMVDRMREYVALHVLAQHRALRVTDENQRKRTWSQVITPPARQRTVGVLGLGQIGGASAMLLAQIGFRTLGWSRSTKSLDGVTCLAGAAGLAQVLSEAEILVCLLPLTERTKGLLDARLFAQLPRGAALINVGRGDHLVETDLLDALDDGRLSAATLDVFSTEPLPPEHPFWTHPAIRITPHVASYIDAETGASVVADNLREFDRDAAAVPASSAVEGY